MKKQEFLEVILLADDARPRSQQTAVGVSSLGGCRRQVWHVARGDQPTNKTTRLAAWMGTAIHDAIERAFKQAIEAGKYPAVMLEHRIEANGDLPPATIDFYDAETKTIIDWKSIKLAGVPYFGKLQQRYQVHTYAYLMIQNGYPVENVQLFGIPRDGDEDDLVDTWVEPYDEAVALEALAWLDQVVNSEIAPEPERERFSWCQKYCQFYGACPGRDKDYSGEAITDVAASDAAKTYVEINATIKALEAQKEAARQALEGVNGITFDGIKVSWLELNGRETPDIDAIKAMLGSVPTKVGNPSLRLTVK